MKKKICIIGLGYIGLPTAAMFATNGHEVVGVDINDKVVQALNKGKITIEEPYLGPLVRQAVNSGKLRAQKAPEEADVFIIAVPTPITKDKKADMRHVCSASEMIVPYLEGGNLVILESTSPPGTVKDVLSPILKKTGFKIGEELFVSYSPERVLPGKILNELRFNNRIVGGINRKSSELTKSLYESFVEGKIFLADSTTAEMCKIMENTFRDVNIALANELAMICENIGINAWEVIELCNHHPRVNIHQLGPGVGGHCLAVDPWFIVEKNPELSNLIKLSRLTNDNMPVFVLNKIQHILRHIKDKKRVTILGITYKPNIDDMRDSPIIHLMELMEQSNEFDIRVIEPFVEGFKYQMDLNEAVEGSDLLLLAVHHDNFKDLPFEKISQMMRNPNFLDTRNFIDKSRLINYNYFLLGSKYNENIEMKESITFVDNYIVG